MSTSSVFHRSEDGQIEEKTSFEGISENDYQDICKLCFNFRSYCKCLTNLEDDDLVSRDSSFQKMNSLRLSPVNLITYSAPTHYDSIRREADVEEYCLKSRYKYCVPSKESRAILTNLFIQRRNGEIPRKLEVKNRIRSDWPNESFNEIFISKAGVVSPKFTGDLIVKIFNKSAEEILIDAGSPVGVLQSKPYDYE